MAGVKGRSGRRIWSREERLHHMRDRAVETTIKFLEDKGQPLLEKAKIAAPLASKELTNKNELVGVDKIIIAYGNKQPVNNSDNVEHIDNEAVK